MTARLKDLGGRRRAVTRIADMSGISDWAADHDRRAESRIGSEHLRIACDDLIERMARNHRVSGSFVRRWIDGRET